MTTHISIFNDPNNDAATLKIKTNNRDLIKYNNKILKLFNLVVPQKILEGPIPTQASQQLLFLLQDLVKFDKNILVFSKAHSGITYYSLQAQYAGLLPFEIKFRYDTAVKYNDVLAKEGRFPSEIDHLVSTYQENKEQHLSGLSIIKDSINYDDIGISACITHYNRPAYLMQALQSLLNQTLKPKEIIILDDGSTEKKALNILSKIEKSKFDIPVRILRLKHNWLDSARNQGWKNASCDLIFYMDDDDIAMPEELKKLSEGMIRTKADIATCQMVYFKGDVPKKDIRGSKRWLPIGNSIEIGFFANLFGPANALYKKKVLEDQKGFTQDYGIGHEDWEFYVNASLAGAKIELIPEALFWCRRHNEKRKSMLHSTDLYLSYSRNLRAYMKGLSSIQASALKLAFDLFTKKEGHVASMWQNRHVRKKM
jgi:glycosyltransferase involved in cell wall biosynthesis